MIDDETLLASIVEGGDVLHRNMRQYYRESKCRTEVLNLLKKRGVSGIEAEDIFQEGVIAFIFNVRKGKFRGEASVKTYIAAICTHIFYNQLRKKRSLIPLEGNIMVDLNDYRTPEYLFIQQEKRQQLDELLAKLGEKCQKILRLWALKYRMEEIAIELNYKSAGMARKKKHQCIKRLMSEAENGNFTQIFSR